MMRIACIHAHPDDAEILAGGTLALLAESGHAVTIVSMTPGDCGSAEQGPDEIASVRREEAAAAARIAGAEYRCAEFRDMAIFNDDSARRRVTELIRSLQPDLVITASPVDYHCDHEATSTLVRDACFAASAPNYDTQTDAAARPLGAIPHLYFADSIGGVNRFGMLLEPDFVVDIKRVFETKKRMLTAHASQRAWLKKQHGMSNYIETMENWTHERGRLVGLDYGEGFRRYPGHPYPQTPLLEQLLSGKVVLHNRRAGDLA